MYFNTSNNRGVSMSLRLITQVLGLSGCRSTQKENAWNDTTALFELQTFLLAILYKNIRYVILNIYNFFL